MRRQIAAANADVIALQELGGQSFLDELQYDLKAEGLEYPYEVVLDQEGEARSLAVPI